MRGRHDVARRIGRELFLATGTAEEVAVARMLGAVLGFCGIDRHPAHGVTHLGWRRRSMVLMAG